MRVSEFFDLGMTQPSLDFLDVDIENDIPIFIDPRAFLAIPSEWGHECVALIKSFFSEVLEAARSKDDRKGKYLLSNLSEPWETHLGLSYAGSRGRGVGNERAVDLWESLKQSQAIQTGLVQDLEETALMIYGIDKDIISDITTNIIREALIEYTQAVCQVYGIPLTKDIPSGNLWDPRSKTWRQNYVQLPTISGDKIVLIPKVIVRYKMTFEQGEYYRKYLLGELREEEFKRNSPLIELLVNGKKRITQKALMEKYGTGKPVLVKQTLKHPEALARYRTERAMPRPALSHHGIARDPERDWPDWDKLLEDVTKLEPGRRDADAYEKAIEALLYAIFYPALTDPRKQTPIHDGRKRVDIRFVNSSQSGFFHWLATNYRAPYIFVECKNYGNDPGNPEIDQLSGRFSPHRGQCGILMCRSFDDKDLFLKRCHDTASDDRGFIIALDDSDLEVLIQEKKKANPSNDLDFPLLRRKFEMLTT